jgi:hypothetical protein
MQVTVPAPPAPPAIPSIPTEIQGVSGASSQAVYKAMVAQRKEVRSQLERLQEQRDDLSRQLRSDEITQADRTGIEGRLKEVDARISATDQQLAQADLAVSKAASVPGAVVEPPPYVRNGPPDEVFAIPIVFTIFVLAPIAIAYARRIWKRGATVIAPVPREITDRLEQMGQAVESIAIEVERIGEGQRFLTRVMGDTGRQLGQGAAQPIQVQAGERVRSEI